MARKTKAKRTAVANVPQTRDEANAMIRQLGELQREAAGIELDMNAQLAQVRETHEARAQPLKQQAASLTDGLQIWAEANRDTLTRNGKVKTANLPAGDIQWRTTPPSVKVTGVEAVVTALIKLFKFKFVRRAYSIDKEAILATEKDHPVRSVTGIKIEQREEFVVLPHDAELSEVA